MFILKMTIDRHHLLDKQTARRHIFAGSGRLAQPTGQIRAVGAFSLGRNFVSILVDEIGRNWGHRPVVVVDVSSVEIVGNGTSKRAFC